MEKKRDIKHVEIVAYLRGESDMQLKQSIEKIRDENPVYHLLFELIEKAKSVSEINQKTDLTDQPVMSFSEIEQMLERLFSGDFSENNAKQFYNGLLSSPIFYTRLLDRLQFAIPELSREQDPDLAKVEIKSDEDILSEVLKSPGRVVEAKTKTRVTQSAEKLGHIFEAIKTFIRIPVPSPRVALLVSGISVAIILFALGYKSIFKNNNYYPYLSENRVPYEYDSSTFRGTDQDMKSAREPLLFAFIRDFKNGVGYYMVQEYESAIYIFENLENSAQILETKEIDPEYTTYFRDLFFYNGLSHLVLSTQKEIEKSDKSKYLNDTIKLLERAVSILIKYNLNGADREAYYLGLAYGLNGQRDLAMNQLGSIKAESQFFSDSQKLLKKWGK